MQSYETFPSTSIIENKTSNVEAFFHLVCILGGAGIVQLSYAIKEGGWLSLIWIPISCLLLYFSGSFLIKAINYKANIDGYLQLGYEAYGYKGKLLVDLAQGCLLIGASSLFIILSSTNMVLLFPNFISFDSWTVISLLFSTLPFIFTKSLKEAAFLSVFGVLSTLIMVMSIIWVSISDYNNITTKTELEYSLINLSKLPFSMASISFSLGGITIFPHVEKSMTNRSQFKKVLASSAAFIAFLYTIIAFVGYLAYGNEVESPIFNNLKRGFLVKLALSMLTLHLIVTIPLLLTNFALDSEPRLGITNKSRFFYRTLISIVVYIIAIYVPYFSDFMALLGALFNGLLLFVFPALFYVKLVHKNQSDWVWILCLLSTGIFVCFVGTYQAVKALMNDIF